MSKLVAAEFQAWESLYWPEGIPRTLQLTELPKDLLSSDIRWRYKSDVYSLDWTSFTAQVRRTADALGKEGCFTVSADDPLAYLIGIATSLLTGLSMEILMDRSLNPACRVLIDQSSSTGDPDKDIKVTVKGMEKSSWISQEPAIMLSFQDDIKAIYYMADMWNAIQSFSAFSGLQSEDGIALLGPYGREFTFFSAVSSLMLGLPLSFSRDIGGLAVMDGEATVLFTSRELARSRELGDFLRSKRRSLSYVGVEGPLKAEAIRSLEKRSGLQVLQMFGASGRGIVLANPRDFNVHGSAGIPITNAEAVISEVLEASWYRGRRLMGPGDHGELALRGTFIDMDKDVGDPRQRLTRVKIMGKDTVWLGTEVYGVQDENGYFYLEEASFR